MGESLPKRSARRLCPPSRPCVCLSVHELCVSLRSCDDHVHPDPHGLRRRGHHVVEPVVGLYAEGQGGVRALEDGRTERKLQSFSCRPHRLPAFSLIQTLTLICYEIHFCLLKTVCVCDLRNSRCLSVGLSDFNRSFQNQSEDCWLITVLKVYAKSLRVPSEHKMYRTALFVESNRV